MINTLIQCVGGANICIITLNTSSFFMGIGFYIKAFCYQFEFNMNKSNDVLETDKYDSQLTCILRQIVILQIKIREQVSTDIQNITKIKKKIYKILLSFFRIFDLTSELMSATIFFEVFFGVVFVSGVMSQFDVIFQQGFLSLMILCLATGLSFGIIFIYCFTGTLVTSSLLQCSDYAYNTHWFRFPVKHQQYIPMILIEAQQPHFFDGFRFVELEYRTYLMVLQ